jgi:hypothetical protein
MNLGQPGLFDMDRVRVLIAIAIGLAATVGMWFLMLAASGFVWP